MSDSEETKPGASSALLNIASAYSDSDSSQENSEDCSPQKSLGSLVENLRAEAKRVEGDVIKGCEGQARTTPIPTSLPSDAEKTHSFTKIVRLDSGKVVKIRTSPVSKASEFRHEESQSKAGSNVVTDVEIDNSVCLADAPVNSQNFPSESFNSAVDEAANKLLTDSAQLEVKADINITSSNYLETRVSYEDNRFGSNQGLHSSKNIVNHPRVLNSESVNSENSDTMGMKNTKEEVRPEKEVLAESIVDENVLQRTETLMEKQEVEKVHNGSELSKSVVVTENSSVTTGECDDDIQEITPSRIIQETIPVHGSNIAKNEEPSNAEQKTESTILNAYLKSKQGLKTDENARNIASEVKKLEIARNPEVTSGGSHFERRNLEISATAGSVAGSNFITGQESIMKSEESHRDFSTEEGLVSKLDMYEVKPRPELKPLPRLERLKVKSPTVGTEGLLQKTEQEMQPSSPALYKMLESAAIPEAKKGPGPAPIKLKRNFSCLSTASNTQPEKKFIPEPSEAARITPSDSEVSSDVPVAPALPEITVLPTESRPQQHEEKMKSPSRIQIPSPSRSQLSPTFQQVSPQSYQPSFTNMINISPNQVQSFQPLKKSPQPVPPQQRVTRREEQKRKLPLILRKADKSSGRARECHRVDEGEAKASSKRHDVNVSSKVMSEGEISIETISSESPEQSASVPFSNSSSNQENSNLSISVNFENVIGSAVASKEQETPLSEDAGSDNARPPPTPTKDEQEEKQPTSFLSQSVEPVEMPTIIIPKKRGRPRKFPLPEASTLVGTWPTPEKNGKSTTKSGKRKKNSKKLKAEPEVTDEDDTSKKRYIPRYKKKIKSTGEEQEVTRSFNKKGRMEVMTEGCKPVTVNQITEYFWPPICSLAPGEKPEGLMIQEQICEYLGVKSFKRKYPSIKRRPVDMEERNYLQENGYVSENMCDMGLTAVFSADIMEIMYNDFPHKFEEYRRYTREKKMKEQKALREKQAAENMDPRKEALESIVSWNTEFNSTRKFKVFHLDERLRRETMGLAVSPFEKVLVVHAPVNVPLCVESLYWKNSPFSAECEVSVHSTQNFQKEYEERNKWIFTVGKLK